MRKITSLDDASAAHVARGVLVYRLAALPTVHLLLKEAVAIGHEDALTSFYQGDLRKEGISRIMLSCIPLLEAAVRSSRSSKF